MTFTGIGCNITGDDMSNPFSITILDANDNVLGDGPLTNVVSVTHVKKLDRIGELTFIVPAIDARTQYIDVGCKYHVIADDGIGGVQDLGIFLHKRYELDATGRLMTVFADDAQVELLRQTVGFHRIYDDEDVADVVDDLVSIVSGWTTSADASMGNTTIMFEGQSVYQALQMLASRWNKHLRLSGTRTLEFGAFGDSSGIRLTNLSGQIAADYAGQNEVGIIDRLSLVAEGSEIHNSVIPLGAGVGIDQLTIYGSTVGSYTVQTGTNKDGSNYYYIQDSTSVTAYGARWYVLTLPNITPETNTDIAKERAADALKLSAEAFMARHLAPLAEYSVSISALPVALEVGDTVRVQYTGVVDEYKFIEIDSDFYVMDITTTREANGRKRITLEIANIAKRRKDTVDIVGGVMQDVETLKVNPRPTAGGRTASSITGDIFYTSDNKAAILFFKLRPWELAIHAVYLIFLVDGVTVTYRTLDDHPADVTGADDGGVGHTHTTPSLTHQYQEVYNYAKDTTSSAQVGININGTDRTTVLGGPWYPYTYYVEIDISDYISTDPTLLQYIYFYIQNVGESAHIQATLDIQYSGTNINQ